MKEENLDTVDARKERERERERRTHFYKRYVSKGLYIVFVDVLTYIGYT